MTCITYNDEQKRRKIKPVEITPVVKERLKKAYNECYKAVLNCEDENGRRRCDLFKELPDKKVYFFFLARVQAVADNV